MKSLNQILENIIWTPDGVDEEKTNTGKRMPSAMKKRVDLLRQELADNGIELGKISSAYRDAYNQGRVMYANWFSKGSNKYRSGESVEDTLKKRKRYLVGLYNDRKAKAVHELYAEGYRKGNDGKGGILPDILGDTLLKVEEYLKKNPISNHQGNRAIDVGPNSKLKNFINSGKSKIAQSVLDEGNHLHIKLRAYDGSDDNTVSSSSGGTQVSDKVSRSEIKNIQRILKNAGYDLGAYGPNKDGVDGYYGKLTKKALENWKSKHGMQANTVLDRDVYNEVISKQGELVDTSLEVDRQTKIENRVNLTTKLPEILPGKSIKIDNLNISKDSNYEIKSALVENLNSFKSIGDILNEDSKLKDLIRKVRNIKKKADTALADRYRGDIISTSPTEDPGGTGGVTTITNTDILKVKPEVFLIHDKSKNKYYIKAKNETAIELLGSENQIELSDEDIENIKDNFRIPLKNTGVSTTPATTTTNTVTSQGTFSNFKTVPSTETEKSLKGAYIANRLTKDLGLTKEQSAGVVGNLWAESSLIPDRIQGSGIKRGTLPEAGKLGYGWAQYTHPSLKSDLIQFAKGKGIDLNTQPMTDELNYEYLKRWISKRSSKLTALKSKSDMRSATEYFLKQYERPKDQSQQQVDKRLRFANLVYNKMA